jgi:hypothetical protein
MEPGSAETCRLILFGRAFLVELDRGNLERAQLFARAFLVAGKREGEEGGGPEPVYFR